MTTRLHLYGHPDSGHAYKVALALRLAGIDHGYSHVDIWAPRESRPIDFRRDSRWHEVPCLRFADGPMVQSGAILARIAVEYDVLGGNSGLKNAMEWIVWEANRIGMALPQLIEARRVPESFSAGTIRWLNSRYEIDSARLDAALAERDFLLGDLPSIADIAVFGYTHWHEKAGVAIGPNIATWLEKIRALPNFADAMTLLGQDAERG